MHIIIASCGVTSSCSSQLLSQRISNGKTLRYCTRKSFLPKHTPPTALRAERKGRRPLSLYIIIYVNLRDTAPAYVRCSRYSTAEMLKHGRSSGCVCYINQHQPSSALKCGPFTTSFINVFSLILTQHRFLCCHRNH